MVLSAMSEVTYHFLRSGRIARNDGFFGKNALTVDNKRVFFSEILLCRFYCVFHRSAFARQSEIFVLFVLESWNFGFSHSNILKFMGAQINSFFMDVIANSLTSCQVRAMDNLCNFLRRI